MRLRAARGLVVRRHAFRFLRRRAPSRDALGRRGERAAGRALAAAGYRILARRARLGGVEVDLVALDGDTVVLVEVKTTEGAAASPVDRVDARKVARLRAAWRALSRDPALAARPRRLDAVVVRCGGGRPRCRILRGHAPL